MPCDESGSNETAASPAATQPGPAGCSRWATAASVIRGPACRRQPASASASRIRGASARRSFQARGVRVVRGGRRSASVRNATTRPPAPAGGRVVAFLTDADLLPPRTTRTPRAWNERLALAPRIREALADAGCRLHAGPRITDAAVAHLEQPAGPGWVAAGDAAVSFDPLSSQGIATALLMGREAGRAVVAMLTRADPEPLVRYGAAYT